MLDFFLDLLAPSRCVVCDRLGLYICNNCRLNIKLVETQVCPVCEKPALTGLIHPGCQRPYSLDGLSSVFSYQGPVKRAVHLLKYKGIYDLTAELMGLSQKVLDHRPDDFVAMIQIIRTKLVFLVPVPLYWLRQRKRGFNQAEKICQSLAKFWSLPIANNLLIRQKNTKSQMKLKGRQRQENIKGAFAINPQFNDKQRQQLKKIKVILVDDVWTTGGTLKTAGAVLKRAGIRQVWGLTICR